MCLSRCQGYPKQLEKKRVSDVVIWHKFHDIDLKIINYLKIVFSLMRCFHDFSEQVKLHIEEVRKLIPLTKRSGLNKSHYLVKYFGVAYDDFRKEVWVSFGTSKLKYLHYFSWGICPIYP